MNVILYDREILHKSFFPFTLTRPVSGLRVGILTLAEKWQRFLNSTVSNHTASYLNQLYPLYTEEDNYVIDCSYLPDEALADAIKKLPAASALVYDKEIIAARMEKSRIPPPGEPMPWGGLKTVFFKHPVRTISRPWDLFLNNRCEIMNDFMLVASGRRSAGVHDPFSRIYNDRNVFVEKDVVIKAAVINAENGPVYIGTNSRIQEGTTIHGPAAFLEGSTVSMGSKIREDSTIGPFCIVGGEVKNSIFIGYSNKAHEGYLGNSVIGEWCNLGADTNNSNLKNNYSSVRVWDNLTGSYMESGQLLCGAFIGDHSKTAIGTLINTGTVIGVSANVFGTGLTPKFIPSFSWGGYTGKVRYDCDKAIESAGNMMARRERKILPSEAALLRSIFELTYKAN